MTSPLPRRLLLGSVTAKILHDAECPVWTAAHVDEDWNMERWGRDQVVLARRQGRFAELQAAEKVLVPQSFAGV